MRKNVAESHGITQEVGDAAVHASQTCLRQAPRGRQVGPPSTVQSLPPGGGVAEAEPTGDG